MMIGMRGDLRHVGDAQHLPRRQRLQLATDLRRHPPADPDVDSSNTSVGTAAASPQTTRIASDNRRQLAARRHFRQRARGRLV